MHNIAVIGCGVIGLSSAIAIQKKFGTNVIVTIFTEHVSPNTTGDISAGLWEPYLVQDTPQEQLYKWSKLTLDFIVKLWKEGKAKEAGINLIPIINLSEDKNYKLPEWVTLSLGWSELSGDHLENLSKQHNKKFTGGFLFVSFTWEPSRFLPLFQQEFLNNGGRIIRQKIENFNQLLNYDIIINCTGLYARHLAQDASVQPIRGQITRVHAPWQFHTILVDSVEACYVIPNANCVILGGTKQEDSSTEFNKTDKLRILRDCCNIIPAMAGAEVIKDYVGLRPGRNQVRLELEIRNIDGKSVKIVHNYGHGGSGVTLCIGCAEEAAQLVQEAIAEELRCKL